MSVTFAGMSVALGIMAIEWALFLVLAWYLEQVLPSGGSRGDRCTNLHSLE
jgi:hypothetical protein